MKLFVLYFLGLVAISMAKPNSPTPTLYPRGCFRILGNCETPCPVGTMEYGPNCSPVTPEATCENPRPVPEDYDTCDFSACYCDAPTVRNTKTNQCVRLEDCPKQ